MTVFQHLHQPTSRSLDIEGQHYLFFGGTAYLGLLDNPAYISLFKEGIDRYGLNNGTSRSNNIQLGIYAEAEEKLASRFGFESAAVFSSGYLAAQAAVRVLYTDQVLIYAPASHPALWLDGSPHVESNDFASWALQTVQFVNSSPESHFIIVSNCIDNLQPANYDFSVFAELAEDKHILFILDDSHGLAVVNKNAISSDIHILTGKANVEVVVVSSLAKGLGTDAGVVLGPSHLLDQVKRHPIFLGASPASPASMYALIHGDAIYEDAFAKLHANIDYFLSKLPIGHGLRHIDRFPVFSSNSAELYQYLVENNILISSFPYPLSTSPLLNRVVLSALHSKVDLDRLVEIYTALSK